MMDRYVFIDESGDLGEKGSRYFVITAIWVDDPAVLDRIIKNLRRHKLKRELSKVEEIKASHSSDEANTVVLEEFARIETAYAASIILDKKKVYSQYLKNDKNKLYNFVAGFLGNIAPESKRLIIRVDRSKGRHALIEDFDNYLRHKFREVRWNRDLEIYHSWSQSWSGLQMADVVSWAVFQKFEHDNDFFYKIIESKASIVHIWK